MDRRPDWCPEIVGKNVFTADRRQVSIEPGKTGKATTKDNHVRVEKIDDAGKCPPQAVQIACQRCLSYWIAGLSQGGNRDCVNVSACASGGRGMSGMVGGESGAGEVGLDAALPTAIALWQRQSIIAGTRQWIVTPFAGNRIGPDEHPAVDHDATTDTGAENDAEHHAGIAAGTIDSFRQRKTVGVIGQANVALEQCLQVAAQGFADQAGRVRILDQSVAQRLGAWNADAHGAALVQFQLDGFDQSGNRHYRPEIISLWRGNASPEHYSAVICQRDDFDFGATQIDTDAQLRPGRRCP